MKEKIEKIGKKNIIIAGVFFISVIIILFGGALIYNKYFYKKTYNQMEEMLVKAAQEYLNEFKEELPSKPNDYVEITENMLVNTNKIKNIDNYIKNANTTCSGSVFVTNINGNYRYVPKLDCGQNYYKTTTFIDYIKKNINIVESGNGLYNLNDELVYRGDNVNNYIKINNKNYRIVKFSDDYPVIIYTEKADTISFDDRYNIEKDDTAGVNDYEVSRMRDYLNNLYNATGKDALLTDANKLMIVQHDLPIGKRSVEDTDNSGTIEKSKILTEQYIGLLPVYDFLNASTDTNCVNINSKACSNYNYLSKYRFNWWTMTANNKNTYEVYRVAGKGIARSNNASTMGYVRPVLYLAKDVIYVSGNGSSENPFIVK